MKKQTQTLLIVAGAGALAYFLFKGKSSARMIESAEEAAESTETGKGAEKMPQQTEVDAVIDVTRTGQTVTQAIKQGKELATALKDANIIIKTPKGRPNIAIKSGTKKRVKRAADKAVRKGKKLLAKAKKYGDCSKIKSKGKRKRCEMAQQKAGTAVAKQLSKFKFV